MKCSFILVFIALIMLYIRSFGFHLFGISDVDTWKNVLKPQQTISIDGNKINSVGGTSELTSQASNSDIRTSNSDIRTSNSDSKTSDSDGKAINSDSQASNSDSKAIDSDSQASNSDSKVINSNRKAGNSYSKSSTSDSQASKSGSQASISDNKVIDSDSKAKNPYSKGGNSNSEASSLLDSDSQKYNGPDNVSSKNSQKTNSDSEVKKSNSQVSNLDTIKNNSPCWKEAKEFEEIFKTVKSYTRYTELAIDTQELVNSKCLRKLALPSDIKVNLFPAANYEVQENGQVLGTVVLPNSKFYNN